MHTVAMRPPCYQTPFSQLMPHYFYSESTHNSLRIPRKLPSQTKYQHSAPVIPIHPHTIILDHSIPSKQTGGQFILFLFVSQRVPWPCLFVVWIAPQNLDSPVIIRGTLEHCCIIGIRNGGRFETLRKRYRLLDDVRPQEAPEQAVGDENCTKTGVP